MDHFIFSDNMDEFAAEARKISKILNFWDFGYFVGALKKHAQENPHIRMQLVLQDYFKETETATLLYSLHTDALMIKSIFPYHPLEKITALLEEIGNEDNRTRIVAKKLLRKNSNMLLKRTLSGDVSEDNTTRKKTKLATYDDILSANSRSSTSTADAVSETSTNAENGEAISMPLLDTIDAKQTATPLVDSQATITYSFEDKPSDVAEVSEVTATDRDILMSIIQFDLNVPKPDEPSSSSAEQHNNDVTSTDSLTPTVVNAAAMGEMPTSSSNTEYLNNFPSYKSEVLPDHPLLLKLEKVTSTEEAAPEGAAVAVWKLFGGVPLAPANVTVAEPSNSDADSANNFALDPVVPNNINVKLLEGVASTSKLPDDENYHLYNHLMEMFNNATRRDVKLLCQKYGANKHQKPSDQVFSCIVSDLLEFTGSSLGNSSDDSAKSEKINSSTTIIVPHSPEEEKKKEPLMGQWQEPPLEAKQRDFQEHPLNLISRTTAATAPNPIFTAAQTDMVANALNAVRTVKRMGKATAPAAAGSAVAPPNRVNDMLEEILTDLMETASDTDEAAVLADTKAEEMEHDNRLIYHLMEMFPEACPKFIRNICKGKKNAPGVLDDLISQILESDYPRRKKAESPTQQMDPEEQLEMLKQILPDADPSYLQIHCDRFIDKPDEIKVFIANAIETRSYPKLKDYLRKQQISAQQKQYTTDFSIENFLEVIPDPVAYFEDPKRKQSQVNLESQHYALYFLRNHFSKIALRSIRDLFKHNGYNFLKTFKALEKAGPSMHMKSKRGECRMPEAIQNIPLLQEIAYVKHRPQMVEHLKLQKVREEEERASAKAAGLLQTCSCCFDDEVMPKDIYTCENGCVFCKECIRRGAEVAFGDGKLDFVCLNHCASHFSLQTLQAVLKPKMFSKVAVKKQLEEVKAAGIEDLAMCPFCDFATIPAKDDKLFRCLNPECMKESCLLCKEPSHVPLRCEEVEKEDDVKRRTYIENKMTEALLRTCYKCGKKFIKAEGCNKMTCSCGALMCYVCGKPVKDYKHFNGPGGDRFDLCPLYSDTNHLHEEAVLKGAEEAKKEIGIDGNSAKLKIDPSADVQKHYKEIAAKNPAQERQVEVLRAREQIRALAQRGRQQHHQHHRHDHQHHHH